MVYREEFETKEEALDYAWELEQAGHDVDVYKAWLGEWIVEWIEG